MEHLLEKLWEHARGETYPYHMPGHKRKKVGMLPEELCKIDITEIDGFDNLHQPEGILRNLQMESARLYGAEESYYLVNGSTCGILSAVSVAVPFGGHILMARNCHKSAYHAAYLRRLRVTYLYPPYLEEYEIFDAIKPQQVREALEREPDVKAVLIVSPTYEGRIADIREIADIVHGKGIPLIVDEAHGAHLGLAAGFPKNSCQLGADLVIHSVHKTLPALTQTALLHVSGLRIDRRILRRFLGIYQSSSPSYLLMAGIDNALQYIETEGQEAFWHFKRRYGEMAESLSACRQLKFLPLSQEQDIGKLLISVKGTGITGKELYNILLQEYHLQMEMASGSFVLAMFTINDGEEAYRRMTDALLDVEKRLEQYCRADSGDSGRLQCEAFREGQRHPPWEAAVEGQIELRNESCGSSLSMQTSTEDVPWKDAIPLAEAWDMPTEPVALTESAGRYIGEFISLYPPGVPLLVPGERMTENLRGLIADSLAQGLGVQGVLPRNEGDVAQHSVYVRVIKEEEERTSKQEMRYRE